MSLSYYIILGVVVLIAARLGYVNYHLSSRYWAERKEKKRYKEIASGYKHTIASVSSSNAEAVQLIDRYVVCIAGITIREFIFSSADPDDKAYMRVCAEELEECLNRKP